MLWQYFSNIPQLLRNIAKLTFTVLITKEVTQLYDRFGHIRMNLMVGNANLVLGDPIWISLLKPIGTVKKPKKDQG